MIQRLDYHFGIRLGSVIIVWFAFGGTLQSAASQNNILSAIILFSVPMIIDYNSHVAKLEENKRRKAIGIWSAVFTTVICLGLIAAEFNLEWLLLNVFVKAIVWLSGLFFVIMAVRDWVAYSSPEEVKYRQEFMEYHRKQLQNNNMSERVAYYKEADEGALQHERGKTGTEK